LYQRAEVQDGPVGWHHAASEEVAEGRGGQHGGRAARSAGNGRRPVGADGTVRPCCISSLNRGGRWLTGGPGATVTGGGVKWFKPFPNSNRSKQIQMFPNFWPIRKALSVAWKNQNKIWF
jgi:hypothetical protein